MSLMFNTILTSAGFAPIDVRLIRHKDNSAERGRSIYELWRDHRELFERYQSLQRIPNRKKFEAPYWAVFVVTPAAETMFAGMYSARRRGLLEADREMPHREGVDEAGSCDVYELERLLALDEFSGRLFIDWGAGALAWVQHAERQDKEVVEIRRTFREPEFPGYLNFIKPLSELDVLPDGWKQALMSARGIYLLACPKTREQYVGSAAGEEGFWGRWRDYARDGHGGNVALKSRKPSDYQVSILEVAGSAATDEEILAMEGLWQTKLLSSEMGLNRSIAKTP